MFDSIPGHEYRALTLDYWKSRIPELDEISISVRAGGKVVRFLHIDSDAEPIEFSPDECHAVLTGG